jgi:hypothetical protein
VATVTQARRHAQDSDAPLPPSSDYAPPIAAPKHPLRYRDGTCRPHRMILYDKIGPGIHDCHWCGRALRWVAPFLASPYVDARGRPAVELTVDHRDGNTRNNRRWNLVPSCRRCNMDRARLGNPWTFRLSQVLFWKWRWGFKQAFLQVISTVSDRVRQRLDSLKDLDRRNARRPTSLPPAPGRQKQACSQQARGPPGVIAAQDANTKHS